jgi:excinuclease ABC subunit A
MTDSKKKVKNAVTQDRSAQSDNQGKQMALDLKHLNSQEVLSDTTYIPNPHKYITVRGAREHNLKNISIVVPKNNLVVFSGLSGSGKSSLVFDTIYAEGQRRYVESLSAYARQFLGLKDKPDVDSIDGLSPAISIDQKSTSQNPRSTVGTITEIYDYLRLLYAKIGIQHCAVCGAAISNESISSMAKRMIQDHKGKNAIFLAPIIQDQKGWHRQHIVEAKNNGFRRVRLDGKIMLIEETETVQLNKQQKHSLEVVIDRVLIDEENRLRVVNSLETAMKYGSDKALVMILEDEKETVIHFNKNRACPNGHGTPGDLEPRLFSFNSPHGACQTCSGLGLVTEIDPDLVVPNQSLSIMEGAIKPLSRLSLSGGWLTKMFERLSQKLNFDLEAPWRELTKEQQEAILYGHGDFEGVITNLRRRYKETTSESTHRDIESYMNKKVCPTCKGARLRPEALAVTIAEKSIAVIVALSIKECLEWFGQLGNNQKLNNKDREIARMILKEIISRLTFLQNVGLEYLSLSRSADTLSGGEAQRIRLATQIGSGLTGVLYILDEPSIGLHQRDNTKLLQTLKHLRDLGNSVLVVEHDEETIRSSDYVVDVGPKAGKHGGIIVASGTPEEIIANPNSPTGRFLSGVDSIAVPKKRRKASFEKGQTVSLDELEERLKAKWSADIERSLRSS